MRLIFAFTILLFSTSLMAQLNESKVYADVEMEQMQEIEFNSLFKPTVISHNSALFDSLGFDPVPVSPNVYNLNIQTVTDFTGDIPVVIEYTEPSFIPGFPQTNYTTLYLRVKPSRVLPEADYVLSTGSNQTIYPLANDYTSAGDITITKIGEVIGGTAAISSNDAIDFTLTGDKGMIIYFTEDSLGTKASSVIHITNQDNAKQAVADLFVDNKDNLEVILSSADFTLDQQPSHGTLVQNGLSHVWTYTPDSNYSGNDNFSFSSTAGGLLDYNVNVLSKANNNSFLVADEVYIPTDGSITFNVLDNDHRSDFSVFSHSSELTEISNGVFEYIPASGFTGDLYFEYKVYTGLQLFTADIIIHVSDFAPTSSEAYDFTIIQDKPLKIKHNSPTEAYTFYLDTEPSNGSVTILDPSGTEINSCDTISGNNTIVYNPNSGYTGIDEFDLEYCTTTGICEIIKVDVNVLASSNSDCICINDCVYEGDHNDDGRVDIKDVLVLGLNVGEGGAARTSDVTGTWVGQYSDNWGHSQLSSNIDLKCGDANGDGYIDAEDFSSIEQNYGQLNSFQTEVVSAISSVPVQFIPQQTAVDSGDLLVIDIVVGNQNYPAIDMNGLAFSFNIAPNLMDSSSVNFTLYEDNWLSTNSPIKDFTVTPKDGQVDIAITRYAKGSADGYGIIGALEFIVEDEVVGLRKASSNLQEFPIELSSIVSVNHLGEYSSHPNYRQMVQVGVDEVQLDDEEILTENAVILYPNPTNGVINLDSKLDLDKIELIDAVGRIVQVYTQLPQGNSILDITSASEGLYFLRMQAGDSTIIKKIHKIDL